jgi:hypothetical protein
MSDERESSGSEGRDMDSIVDDLASAGRALRAAAPGGDGSEVIVAALRGRARRPARTAVVLGAVAAVVTVALAGSVVVGRDRSGAELAAPVDAAAVLLAGLPEEPVDPRDVELVPTVERFGSCGALIERLRRVGAEHVGSQGFGGASLGYGLGDGENQRRLPGSATDESSSDTFVPTGPTLGTNVIVEGVDEPDRVKAVDHLVLEVVGDGLRVIDTTVPAVVGSVELRSSGKGVSGGPSSLLVRGRAAIVLGSETVTSPPLEGDPSAAQPAVQYLTVTQVDLSDPAAPVVGERVRIEGNLVAARMVDAEVRMVVSSSMADLPFVHPMVPNAVAPALEANRRAVATSEVGDWIPVWDHGDGTAATPMMGCEHVVVPETFAGVQMTSMVAFDLGAPFALRSEGLLAPSDHITATADEVVVGAGVWVDPALLRSNVELSDWSTALHRFRFEEGAPRYVGSGEVSGALRSDFSMAVLHDGTLGVVTTAGDPWHFSETAEVRLHVLGGAVEERLEEVAVQVLGTGSSVAGLRFLGDRLLVSSGLRGDVVSEVDLSAPPSPVVRGEVTLPGAGAYFHPLGEDRVLVVGDTLRQDGDQWISGVHVTVVALGEPAVVASWSQEMFSSAVGGDHHQFTWWPERGLAVFGLSSMTLPQPDVAVFAEVRGDALDTRSVTPNEAPLGPPCRPDQEDRSTCDSTGRPQVDRVLVVGGELWLHTGESLERIEVATGESTALVPLRPS